MGRMAWMELAPFVAAATVLLLVPGFLVAIEAGLRGFAAIAVSPGISVTVVALSAVFAGRLGSPWSWWAVGVGTLVALVFALAWRWAASRFGWAGANGTTWWSGADAWCWGGLALACLLWLRHLRNVLERPDAFSQTFDNIFHLSAVRLIHASGDASSLTLGRLNAAPGDPVFYPAAFHDLVSLVLLVDSDQLAMAFNGVLVALVAVAWPLSCLFLARCALPGSPALAIGTAVLSASFTGFPLLMLDYGVLYPNLTGLVLVPLALGVAAQVLRLVDHAWLTASHCLFVGLAIAPGLTLAHPNATMSFLLLASPLVVACGYRRWAAWRSGRLGARTLAWQLAGLAALLVVAALMWPIVRPPEAAATWPPDVGLDNALGQALLNSPHYRAPAWAVSALTLLGAFVAVRRRLGWLLGSWLVAVGFWMVAAGWGNLPARMLLTGVWYNDPRRLASLVAMAALPLAALGFVAATEWVVERLRLTGWQPLVVTALAALALLGTTQRAPYMNKAIDEAGWIYGLHDDSPVLSADEYALIKRLPQHVGPDDTIATNPWNGSSLAYAFTGLRTTTKHVLYYADPEVAALNNGLSGAAGSPAVCDAVRALGVRYALDFGPRQVHGNNVPNPGFDGFATAKGFVEVDRQGPAVLYRVEACG